MESGLTFNQLICEFESRHPCQLMPIANFRFDKSWFADNQSAIGNRQSEISSVGRSLKAEHRTVTAQGEGSTPFDPPNHFRFPIADCRQSKPWRATVGPHCQEGRSLAGTSIDNRQLTIVNAFRGL